MELPEYRCPPCAMAQALRVAETTAERDGFDGRSRRLLWKAGEPERDRVLSAGANAGVVAAIGVRVLVVAYRVIEGDPSGRVGE